MPCPYKTYADGFILDTVDDPVKRAQSYYIAQQYDALVSKHWALYSRSNGGKDTQEFKDLFDGLKKFLTYVPDEFVESKEYSVGDILVAPFLVRYAIVLSIDLLQSS